jgi:Ca2+-transporting ATPase
MFWWALSKEEVLKKLNTNLDKGLSYEEVKLRLQKFGENKLPESKKESVIKIFLDQFKSPLIYILLVASFIVYLLGDLKDSLIIIFVLFFNAFVGSFNEIKARNAIFSLNKFIENKTTVLREGKEYIIDVSELVPGDIVLIREGEKIPADLRIVESYNLKIDESALTGESIPVHKKDEVLKEDTIVQERHNMVFMGTTVVGGYGKGIVVETGIETFMGQISQKILSIDTEIPLKKDVRFFSKILLIIILISVLFLFILGIFTGKNFREMFFIVVALSVSVIPEGLPVLLTITLARGVWIMAQKNALVKKLQAVESLGQVKIIAVDKTGTITKNELVIKKVFINNNFFDIEGNGYESSGKITFNNRLININNYPELNLAGKIAMSCADAVLSFIEDKKIWKVSGDPTEASMLVFAQKLGFNKEKFELENSKINEIPFDYKNKYHAVLRKINKKDFVSVVGAPEKVLELSNYLYTNLGIKKLNKKEKEKLYDVFQKMSEQGLRILGFSYKEKNKISITDSGIDDLVFCGFFGIEDSLKPEVKEAVEKVKRAGVKIVMITGDHKLTALSIAREAGILEENSKVLTGEEIDKLTSDALIQEVEDVSVFARVTPEHKLKIIEAYRKRGDNIAMTGDGVNDAPSLVAADLGVAMGKIGTEVAKDASDIILLDDNFGTIVEAMKEGRVMYKNIQKIILFLVGTSFGEFLSISAGVLLGLPNIILPAQILWLNLVTDPFMATPLAFEKEEENILEKKFNRSKYIIDKLMMQRIVLMGFVMMFGALYVFNLIYEFDLARAQTLTLLTLAIFQWFNAWNCRFENKSIFKELFSNKYLLYALGAVIILQILAIYLPVMNYVLNTVPLSFYDWILAMVVSLFIIFAEELRKYIVRNVRS